MNHLLMFLVLILLGMQSVEARPSVEACPAGHTITKTFASGSRWSLCWTIRNEEGLVLSDVKYQAVGSSLTRILGEASLSQIQTEYDDASASDFLVTDSGLGGTNIQTLTNEMCEGGTLHQNQGREVLCETYRPDGYIYRYRNSQYKTGNKLDIFSVSTVNSHEYIVRWRFLENGTIEPSVGLTGYFSKTTGNTENGWTVTNQDKVASSFVNHYFWRLDFDLANNAENDIIEEIISTPSSSRLRKTKSTQTVSREKSDSLLPSLKKFWRIRDQSVQNDNGKPISFEMILLNYAQQSNGNTSSPWLKQDVFLTNYNACERFAVDNPIDNCGSNVSEFTNSENINSKDIVIWYRAAQHTLPRDEDFSAASPQWSSFKLLPRDWTASNSL